MWRRIDDVAKKGITTVWLNPGADAPEVVAKARALGLDAHVACSIIGVGENPAQLLTGPVAGRGGPPPIGLAFARRPAILESTVL